MPGASARFSPISKIRFGQARSAVRAIWVVSHYPLGQWAELNVFATDGAVPIDNNVSEREMKRVILNRKNSLFVGNARGGRTSAILASLTSTSRRHDIDPQLYLTQLLVNLPVTPDCDLSAWLPDRWKPDQKARLANLQSDAVPAS